MGMLLVMHQMYAKKIILELDIIYKKMLYMIINFFYVILMQMVKIPLLKDVYMEILMHIICMNI